MQAIFAYLTAKEADYNICKQKAQDQFLPDLNSMEVQDKKMLSQDRETTGKVFDQVNQGGFDSIGEDIKPDIIKEVKHFRRDWQNRLPENKIHFKKRMIADLSAIYDDYIKLLSLIIEIEELIDAQKRKKGIEHNNFKKNIIITALKKYEPFQNEKSRKNISWDSDLIRAWHKEYIKSQEFYEEYDNLSQAKYEDDLELCLDIYKNVIFKHDNINDYFESLDIGWTEDKPILKSMVLKTIKSIEKEGDEPLLMELSKNWEEDLDFLKELYDLTIDNEEELSVLIKEKSQNWEIDRVALTDRIILEMAIAEMTHFPSIPVKVTINEYIELSKQYSTPKSKQFVNGLLDVLSVDLQEQGRIKKSGRGLLDNK
ncbi:transcription antitermination factor NusB [Reichenbachiella agarivorans]|uniref:Transcription antitermination factor NusB n=1 Tax=Reichenbachiella agarivorans TaxID=2979464 RepID=A0ABY6CZZ3_9BACT|nr:transcription antitermination factor NusB [Reichenbachiella agarivorans]UXP33810.1 transcription antitermination factor NusB [Reichenbachiella agarivorans]